MTKLKDFEVWFVTGSQHLYGAETLKQVDDDSSKIADFLNKSAKIPCKVVFKPVLKTPDEITNLCVRQTLHRNASVLSHGCTHFSPAKMWIAGLSILKKPFVHLHTQFNQDIPWKSYRHGLHEPQPVGSRRQGVRIYLQQNA